MSKYIDAVKRARPEHLYVLDLDRTALDGGTVTDNGFNPIAATVIEDPGFAVLEPVESYIEGMKHNVKFNVLHDTQANNPNNYASLLRVTGVAGDYFGADGKRDWTLETVIALGDHRRSRFDEEADFQGTDGLTIERSGDGWKVVYRVASTSGVQKVGESVELAPYTLVHVAVTKTNNSFVLYVNGVPSGSIVVDGLLPVVDTNLYIGGVDSQYHSDATVGMFALYAYAASSEEVKNRYTLTEFNTNYDLTLYSFIPNVTVEIDPDGSVGTQEPFARKISDGTDNADLYENENGQLRIQTDQLSAGVTKYKTLKYDLTGLSEGVRTYLDIEKTVDANSSLTVNYSFDDVSYSLWIEGEDKIPELDAEWGGVI